MNDRCEDDRDVKKIESKQASDVTQWTQSLLPKSSLTEFRIRWTPPNFEKGGTGQAQRFASVPRQIPSVEPLRGGRLHVELLLESLGHVGKMPGAVEHADRLRILLQFIA